MNRNLERSIENAKKVEALMFAYEYTYLEGELDKEDFSFVENRMYAFMAIQDAVQTVLNDLDCLQSDTRIVSVVEAIASKKEY